MKVLSRAPWGLVLLLAACASRQTQPQSEPIATAPYQEDTILREAESFFGRGAQGVADALNRVFADNGPPGAYINIDAFIPGCPPKPEAIIAAVVKVIGALRSGELVPGCLTQPRIDGDWVTDAARAQ